VGMQILFDESEEFGPVEGLGILHGRVRRFRPVRSDLKVPHMGWNRLSIRHREPLLVGVPEGAYVYFVHSYYVDGVDPTIIATTTRYDVEFVSSVANRNLMATQFHPEKSQTIGLQMLSNFAALAAGREPLR
ncbi:MAG: imidazole glycerol phosphate synthase subunit HisH, partial [Deltaproteobacteria bacterium]